MKKPTEKLQAAIELLNCALHLYYQGNAYFAALHLAGGAEEVFGVYVARSNQVTLFKQLKTETVRLSTLVFNDKMTWEDNDIPKIMNHAKNRTKHMNSKDDDHVDFDPKTEAHALLDRAVSNYYALMNIYDLPETAHLRRFNLELVNHEV